ncbi:helix-turn-helix domain-containing protein [Frankia sp. Cr1]|uniref:helix-turn-helix domain-containing protein n=1 Tax=Frankia sp. Cr1 TaxID=3073931 RepID=UPI002AD26619|nr:helix-turn-helix domain-containing protein [Frankia sp. Cr1]
MPPTTSPYTVSRQVLDRDDMRTALNARDFGTIFRLLKKYDGASQDRIASPIEGLTQSRVSRIMRDQEHIMSIDLIERIADALRIPGELLRLAPRPWETTGPTPAPPSQDARAEIPAPTPPAARSAPEHPASTPGDYAARERSLSVTIDIAADASAQVTYTYELVNIGTLPITRLVRELWFKHTTGILTIAPAAASDRNVIIQRIHDTITMSKFACQIFPALQPSESAIIAYTCDGGRFLDELYWRQAFTRPTDRYSLAVRHRGTRQLLSCTAVEEHADGSEVSATDGLTWKHDQTAIVIELTRANLAPNHAVTLRWDADRDPAQ